MGKLSLSLSSATNADQGEDAGQPVARKASSTSVFILSLKPAGYIYSSQTYPEQSQEEEDVARDAACVTPGTPTLLISNLYKKIEAVSVTSAECKHILDIRAQECDSLIHPLP